MEEKEELFKRLKKIYIKLGNLLDRGGKNFCGTCRQCCTYNFLHGVCAIEYDYIDKYLRKKGNSEGGRQFKDYIRKKRTVDGKLLYRGCPLYDEEKKGCSIYPARPYSCRLYGLYGQITPPLYCSHREFTIIYPRNKLYEVSPMATEFFEVKTLYEILLAGTGKEKSEKYYTMAVHKYYRDNPEKSIHFLELAVKEDRKNSEAYYQMALYYYNKNNLDKAINILYKALKYSSENLNLKINLGLFLMQTGELSKAAEEFISVLDKNPENTMALTAMGNLSLIAGNMAMAEKYCKKALEISPSMGLAGKILEKIENQKTQY